MKKLLNILVLFSILFSCFSIKIKAVEYGTVKTPGNNGLNVRNGPGTLNYSITGTGISEGALVKILGTVNTSDGSSGCASGKWYKIEYSQSNTGYGYGCSSLINIITLDADSEFEKLLLAFPESYRESLRVLHAIYPKANFAPYDTGLIWNEALWNESNEAANGKSLFWDSNSSYDGWKYLSSYNFDTNKFYNGYDSNGNFFAASQPLVAYHLDPRNFLNETSIFQFESLGYDKNTNYTIEGIEGILRNSFMYNAYVDGGTAKKFSDVIMEAAITSSVNPYYIAGRILQETGPTRSALVKGTYPDYPSYNGYYNFFNYGAYKNSNGSATYNGLVSAYNNGWNSEEKSIKGGVSKIANNYIKDGQDTGYFQKWDVVCKVSPSSGSCYNFQYMTNIQAPNSEARNAYNGYKKSLGSEMYNVEYTFKIPIYKDMPASSPLPSSSNPINYLNRLVINGTSIANFYGLTTEYNLTVPSNTTSLNIEASAIAANKGATVSGVGNIKINSEKQDINIVVTAANGSKLTYTIHVTRLKPDESLMTLDETIKAIKGVTIDESYISGLTSFDTVKEALLKANPDAVLTIKDLNGSSIGSSNLGTGYKVNITVGSDSKDFEVIIYGDTNGDSEITILDLLRIQKHLLGSSKLTNANLKAGNVSRNGEISILDLLKIQKHLLGSSTINQ